MATAEVPAAAEPVTNAPETVAADAPVEKPEKVAKEKKVKVPKEKKPKVAKAPAAHPTYQQVITVFPSFMRRSEWELLVHLLWFNFECLIGASGFVVDLIDLLYRFSDDQGSYCLAEGENRIESICYREVFGG
jgi:hypothetical protein